MKSAAVAVLGATALLAVLVAVSAQAAECPSTPYRLSIDSSVPAEHLITTQDNASLAEIQRVGSKQGDIVQGLTSVTYHSTYKVAYSADMLEDGTVCTHVDDLTVYFNIPQPPDVYLAREIAGDACMSQVVLDHEHQHLAIAHETVAEGHDELETRLSVELDGRNGERAGSMKDGMSVFDGRITHLVDTVTKRLYAKAQARNDALDTPDNYEKISNACPR